MTEAAGSLTNLKLLVCPSDSIIVYGRDFGPDYIKTSNSTISYSYRGVSKTPGGTFASGNFGGPNRISDPVQAVFVDRLFGANAFSHSYMWNVGYSDGSAKSVFSHKLLSLMGQWKRGDVWSELDALRMGKK